VQHVLGIVLNLHLEYPLWLELILCELWLWLAAELAGQVDLLLHQMSLSSRAVFVVVVSALETL